jgi:uncharacterized protein YggU (UPF0235/DUF167 family)
MPEHGAPDAAPGLRTDGNGVTLELAIVPGARRSGADGLHDGVLKVRLAARPIEGQANAALLAWLAEELHCPKRALRLVAGATSRRKRVAIDLPAATVAAWLGRVSGADTAG